MKTRHLFYVTYETTDGEGGCIGYAATVEDAVSLMHSVRRSVESNKGPAALADYYFRIEERAR